MTSTRFATSLSNQRIEVNALQLSYIDFPKTTYTLMHPKRLILWIIWFAITSGFCAIYLFLGQNKSSGSSTPASVIRLFPFILLVSAIAVRFMLLPRFKSLGKVLQIFIIGLSLAESAGFMATFLLSADDARTCFVATLTVLLMYAPFFANKLETD